MTARSQNYKPLDPVELPDNPSTIIRVEENDGILETYYTASHMLASRGMHAWLGVPPSFDIYMKPPYGVEFPKTANARMIIGGEEYWKAAELMTGGHIYIDLLGAHVKHIAVSGIQSIEFISNGDVIAKMEFNLIEQELWRKTAEQLCKTIEKYNIL